MLLEQIMKRQEELQTRHEKENSVKVRSVPSSELDPEKGLRAKDYLENPGATPDKTMGLKLPGSMHERMEKLVKNLRITEKSKRAIALRALEIGMKALEQL